MQSIILDISTAFRLFKRRKVATLVIIATMALAIAADTTAFAVVHALLFGNLGVPDANRVVVIPATKVIPGQGRRDFSDAYPNYLLLKEATHSFSALAATVPADVNWTDGDDTRRIEGARVTASLFDVMQVHPVIGRAFTSAEEGPDAKSVALISHRLWRTAFNGNPTMVGKTMRLNGVLHTIIGVMPPGYAQPTTTGAGIDVWLPFDLPQGMWTTGTTARQVNTYGRLKSGVTVAVAQADLQKFAIRAKEADPINKDWGWRVQTLRDQLLSGSGNVVVAVQCSALVLLLLAICNLASVLIAWAGERDHETAMRLALGATTWRIIRQSLVQSLILVAVAGVCAVGLTWLALPALQHLNPDPVLATFLRMAVIDWPTIAFAFGIITGTGVLVGFFPVLQTRSLSVSRTLVSQARGMSANPTAVRLQKGMVAFQAGISVLILICATLAGIGLAKVSRVRLGFEGAGRVCFHIECPEPAYAQHEKRVEFVRSLEANLATEPTLAAYGLTTTLPVGDPQWGGTFLVQLANGEFTADPLLFQFRRVSPGYISVMGIPLIEGRLLNERDRVDSKPVAVVSKTLADRLWPGQTAIGRKIRKALPKDSPLIEIVGVVGNVRDAGTTADFGETVYVPFEQVSLRKASIVLYGRGSTADTVAAGRRALSLTSRDVAAFGVNTLEELTWQSNALPRLQMVLFAAFALVAIAITSLGTYGVMSQLVGMRQKELAIRTALGATRQAVFRLILVQNAQLAVAGTMGGTVTAWFVAQWLQSRLTNFDASSLWPFTLVGTLVLLLTQAASLLPA